MSIGDDQMTNDERRLIDDAIGKGIIERFTNKCDVCQHFLVLTAQGREEFGLVSNRGDKPLFNPADWMRNYSWVSAGILPFAPKKRLVGKRRNAV